MGVMYFRTFLVFGIGFKCVLAADSKDSNFTPSYIKQEYKAPIYQGVNAPAHLNNVDKRNYNGAYFINDRLREPSSFTPSYIKQEYKRPVLNGKNAPTHLGGYDSQGRGALGAKGEGSNTSSANMQNGVNIYAYDVVNGRVSQSDIDSIKIDYTKNGYSKMGIQNNIVASSLGFELPMREEAKNIVFIEKRNYLERGYQSLEQVLQYSPFISFVHNGFGNNIDLRGQGHDASRAVKLLSNRVPISLLDTSHGVPAYNNISIEDVESIEIIPGGGAILYGSGSRGGVINITTKKPSNDFFRFNLKGASGQSEGLQGGATSIALGKKIGNLFIRGDVQGGYIAGVRNTGLDSNGLPNTAPNATKAFSNDNAMNLYTAFQALYDFGEASKIDFNINYSHIWNDVPQSYLSFTNADGSVKSDDSIKKQRNTPSPYTNKTQVDAMIGSLNYNYDKESFGFDLIAFYQFSFLKYTHIDPHNVAINSTPTNKQEYIISSQNDKYQFQNRAGGLNFRARYNTDNNVVVLGLDSIAEYSNRTNYLKSTLVVNQNAYYEVEINNNALKLTNSIYVLDKYNITDSFSLTGGARAEYSNYWITNNQYADFRAFPELTAIMGGTPYTQDYRFQTQKNNFGYSLELTPSYKYSTTGTLYGKATLGFINPSPFQMISTTRDPLRYCGVLPENSRPNNCDNPQVNFEIDKNLLRQNLDSNLKLEQFITGEIGIKDSYDTESMSIYGAITAYYTHTFDEIYADSVAHGTIYSYSNLGQTQRAGIEIFSMQKFFKDDLLRLSQSIAGLYSNILVANASNAHLKGKMVPYTPWLKATFNIEADVFRLGRQFLSAFLNNAYFSESIDTTAILDSNLTDTSVSWESTQNAITNYNPSSHVMNKGGYFLSDLGLIYGFGGFRLNAGVRNLFDSHYVIYQKYPSYIPAMGRSYYMEISYKF